MSAIEVSEHSAGHNALLGMRGAGFLAIIHPTLYNTRRGKREKKKGHYCPHGIFTCYRLILQCAYFWAPQNI